VLAVQPFKFIFKTFIVVLGLFFIACFILLYAMTSSPQVLQAVVKASANQILPDITIQDLVIGKQNLSLKGTSSLRDVDIIIRQGENKFDLHFNTISLSDIFSEKPTLLLKGGFVYAEAFRLDGLEMTLIAKDGEEWSGPATVKLAESSGFQVHDVLVKVIVKADKAIIEDIQGRSYEGEIQGTATIYFFAIPDYYANVTFDGLDTTLMEDINPSLFSQLQGQITGSVEALGPAGGLDKIDLHVRLNDGGEVQSKLLGPLLGHIPESRERQKLKTAIENNQKIIVNKAQLDLSNKDSKTVSTDIQLESDELNLDANVKVDIIVEGGMQSLFKYFTQFSQFMKG